MDIMQVRQKIIDTAKEKGLSQRALISKAELNIQFLQDMKSRNSIKAECLEKIADVLDVSIDYLVGRTDNPKSHKL